MKHLLGILFIFLAFSCSTGDRDYNYIKVFGIERTMNVSSYNKGMGTSNFLYYNPESDSVLYKYKNWINELDTFKIYSGNFRGVNFSDSLSMLISYLEYANGDNPDILVDLNRQGIYFQGLLVEYSTPKGTYYKIFDTEIYRDTITRIIHLLHALDTSKWNRNTAKEGFFNDESETVNFLKGVGVYDSLLGSYVPLPCKAGFELDKLYGNWRTIGDKYNDATIMYWTNRIDSTGKWIIERVTNGKTEQKYMGKIKSIKGRTILIDSEYGKSTLEISILTDNCFEYKHKGSNQIWRLDRMR